MLPNTVPNTIGPDPFDASLMNAFYKKRMAFIADMNRKSVVGKK